MTDINNQIIYCPYCKTPITVDELGEYVNANPETKKQAVEQEIELWGEDVYDRNYLLQNVVFCPNCDKVSHFKDWDSDNKEKENEPFRKP
jgi:uncharacterized Zn finger protein (UPF0148 family)